MKSLNQKYALYMEVATLSDRFSNESMLEMFIFETSQLVEQLEKTILSSEETRCYTSSAIDEIFRIMHTIKGSSAMMLFNNISTLSHTVEDIFFFLREEKPQDVDCSNLSDMVLESVDFIKLEILKIKNGDEADGDPSVLIGKLHDLLAVLKQGKPTPEGAANKEKAPDEEKPCSAAESKPEKHDCRNSFKAVVRFEEGCEMENIRAYSIVHNLSGMAEEVCYTPRDIIDNDDSVKVIREQGFCVQFKTNRTYEEMNDFFMKTLFIKDLELVCTDADKRSEKISGTARITQDESFAKAPAKSAVSADEPGDRSMQSSSAQSMISVNVAKLDRLMDLVGEMVIAEAMVAQNPDLRGLQLDNFQKATRQLGKITGEIQDMVMSIRMVPLSTTFHKMHRVVRDMSKKLGKEVSLEIRGEETEVDKNIIEHISDPLMHLVRNAIDHGIEPPEERIAAGKPKVGKVALEARNAGSDVLVIVKDDGRGLNREKLLKKARDGGLLYKPESEMSNREVYSLIFSPGFSTKEDISEFSGRGVGLDIVMKNIGAVGGSVSAESQEGAGTTIIMKIPLTLAIIDGMNIRVGNSCYTIPTISIKESFRSADSDVIRDPDGNEMVMVRGQCYPVLRLHKLYGVKTEVTGFSDGIMIMVEQDEKSYCVFADELSGQQQVVVKALPAYIRNMKRIKGLAGCTLLGDGSISLIIDVAGLLNLGIHV